MVEVGFYHIAWRFWWVRMAFGGYIHSHLDFLSFEVTFLIEGDVFFGAIEDDLVTAHLTANLRQCVY